MQLEKIEVSEVAAQPAEEVLHSICPAMASVRQLLPQLALLRAPLVITGEPGTGKRFVAEEIHRLSSRKHDQFTAVDCATLNGISNNGNSWGNGTVLLHDITTLSDRHQRELLDEIASTADFDEARVRPRFMASSEKPIENEVRGGKFREDLFYRLGGVSVYLPPLRQRKEDIPILAQYFAKKFSSLLGRSINLSCQILEMLTAHNWPGNIRELESIVRTIVAIGDETIAMTAIRALGLKSISGSSKIESLSLKQASRAASRNAERELILGALFRTHWNRKRAAKELQISYKALLYKLKQIGIDEDQPTLLGVTQ